MAAPDHRLYFAGTTAMDQPDVPSWFADGASDEFDAEAVPTFGEAYLNLITADVSTEVAWPVPDSFADDYDVSELNDRSPEGIEFFASFDGGVWATTTSHNAVYSPELLQRLGAGDEIDPLLNIPTDSYGLVNPYDFYRPLEDAMEANDIGQHCFGEFRIYDEGAEVHGDVYFDTHEIPLPQGEGAYKFGIQTGYDFKGNRALYANIIAQQTACSNTLRSLADKKTRRHVSSEDDWGLNTSEYEDWWAELLEKIDLVADELTHVIEDAANIGIRFDVTDPMVEDGHERVDVEPDEDAPIEVPFSLEEFYRLAGAGHGNQAIPEYLREAAATDARKRSMWADETLSLWDIHAGLTYALTHVYRGGERGSLLQYNQIAKDLIYNPHEVLNEIAQRYEWEVSEDETDEAEVVGETGRAMVARSVERVSDRREEFADRQERIEQILAEDEQTA